MILESMLFNSPGGSTLQFGAERDLLCVAAFLFIVFRNTN